MAKTTQVTLTCDLPHDGEAAAVETLQFAYGSVPYEIDVCAGHSAELHDRLGAIAGRARRSARSAGGRRAGPRDRVTPAQIRAWCAEEGRQVSPYGRIPAADVRAYEAVH